MLCFGQQLPEATSPGEEREENERRQTVKKGGRERKKGGRERKKGGRERKRGEERGKKGGKLQHNH